jgi:NitT/TauT family transport system permease protein/sulfonate transport system permease protein
MTGTPAARERISVGERAIAEAGVLGVLVAWWFWSRDLPAFVLPGPEAVARRMVELALDPAFLLDVALSILRVALALVVAMALGTALALLPFYRPASRHVIDRVVLPFFNSFPSLGWVLLATIWFGVSERTVLLIQVAILLPFCIVNVSEGVRVLDGDSLELGRSFTPHRGRVFVRIVLPLLTPYLVAALRISYGVAWKIALLAELFGARDGIGYVMLQGQVLGDSATVLAACLYIVLIFVVGERWVIRPLSARFAGVGG